MTKYKWLSTLWCMFIFCACCKAQIQREQLSDTTNSISHKLTTSYGPNSITRNIIQDRSGDIWIASFKGVFRYDGKSFTNITSKVSSARFFSVLEDSKGNFWFGSIGSGVYFYDGESFTNFTTREGLINNEIVSIYEDKIGNIWLGANGGVSRYDGKSFLNYFLQGEYIIEDRTGKTFQDFTRPPNEVNSIVEDKTGKIWFGTRGNTFVYDGKAFSMVIHNDKSFRNVRTIINDKKGNIWLAGNDGLWRYDGSRYTHFTENFVGYVYEDRKGNIWTSSETVRGWVLSRYDGMSLDNSQPTVTEIKSDYPDHKGMLFGILEANDGGIWFGSFGVYRYDGNTIVDFKR